MYIGQVLRQSQDSSSKVRNYFFVYMVSHDYSRLGRNRWKGKEQGR